MKATLIILGIIAAIILIVWWASRIFDYEDLFTMYEDEQYENE